MREFEIDGKKIFISQEPIENYRDERLLYLLDKCYFLVEKKSRLALVFAFGLLHGLGFASMLADFGMPDNAFVTALISFNIGVELGQLSILLVAFLFIGLVFSKREWYKPLVINPASLLIAMIAFYWFIDRLEY